MAMDLNVFFSRIVLVAMLYAAYSPFSIAEIVELSQSEQMTMLQEKRGQCIMRMMTLPTPEGFGDKYCARTWDGVLCFDDTAPGEVAKIPCPNYVHGFNTRGYAYRHCSEEGEWVGSREPRTNYSECFDQSDLDKETLGDVTPLVEQHIGKLQIIYNTGYCVSLALLTAALLIMGLLRKLYCPRNYIHMNLFVSFILRAALCILKDNLMKGGLGFPADVEKHSDMDTYVFKESGTHWQCKLFFTVFNYIIVLNYTWIFLEGLYLHNLIFVRVMSEQTPVKWYCIGAWVSPLLPVVPWILTRVYQDDTLCWNASTTKVHWIIRGPIIALILVNFALFVNVIRVLFRKLSSPVASHERKHKYRKLARSTLVLIPLFGVYYITTIFFPDNISEKAKLFQLYCELIFNSWSGAFIAILFCFLNREVRTEIRKKIRNIQQARASRNTPLRRMSKGSSFTLMTTTLPSSPRKGSGTPSLTFVHTLKNDKGRRQSFQFFAKSPSVMGIPETDNDSVGGSLPRDASTFSLGRNSVTFQDTCETIDRPRNLRRKLSLPVARRTVEIEEQEEPMLVPPTRRRSDALLLRENRMDFNNALNRV